MHTDEQSMMSVEKLYASSLFGVDDMQKLREKFTIACAHCKSGDVAIMVKGNDDGGGCDTCGPMVEGIAVFKCRECGQAIAFTAS